MLIPMFPILVTNSSLIISQSSDIDIERKDLGGETKTIHCVSIRWDGEGGIGDRRSTFRFRRGMCETVHHLLETICELFLELCCEYLWNIAMKIWCSRNGLFCPSPYKMVDE